LAVSKSAIKVVKVTLRDDAANTTTLPESPETGVAMSEGDAASSELAAAALDAAALDGAALDGAAAEVGAEADGVAVFFDELHALKHKATVAVAITAADTWRFIGSPVAIRGRRVAPVSNGAREVPPPRWST
jgi:hypothetical protein